MVSHRKHKTVGGHLLTKILPKDDFDQDFLMIRIKDWESVIGYWEVGMGYLVLGIREEEGPIRFNSL